MTPYPEAIEHLMRKYYGTLSEKDRRRYAAIEAQKLGHGGLTYIAQVLGCAQSTIAAGIQDLAALPEGSGYEARIRRPGGGRKSAVETVPDLEHAFWAVLDPHTAGDPMQADVRWTHLSCAEIVERLHQAHGIAVSEPVIKQLLEKHNFTRRKAQKK